MKLDGFDPSFEPTQAALDRIEPEPMTVEPLIHRIEASVDDSKARTYCISKIEQRIEDFAVGWLVGHGLR